MALDYSVVKVDSFTVDDGHVVDGSWRVTPPSVYPPGFNASICGVSICGTPVALGTPSGQFGTVHPTFLRAVNGVGSGQLFGTPKFQLRAPPGGVGSAAAFGVPAPKATFTRSVGGVSTAQAFGTPSIKTTIAKGAGGVASAQAFGVVTAVGLAAPQTKAVSGVGSGQQFGSPTVKAAIMRTVGAVPTAQAFGTPTTRFTQQAGGVPSAQQFGVPRTRVSVPVGAVDSAQAFGAIVATTKQTVAVSGVETAQQFGQPWVGHLWLEPYHCAATFCDETTICGEAFCGGDNFLDQPLSYPPIVLVSDECLGAGLVVCDETTICGTVVCDAAFIEIPGWPPSPLIVDTFLCDQRLVGTGYVEPITVTRTIDLQPAGCV